jgi:hypothetical protein
MNIRAYMSHPIRGPLKDKATEKDMQRNNDAARALAERIRLYMSVNYSSVDFDLYVPAEHEEFVNRAYRDGMLKVQQILYIDCQIISEAYNDLLLVYAPFGPPVEGCSTELIHARKHNVPDIIFENLEDFKAGIEIFLEARKIYE